MPLPLSAALHAALRRAATTRRPPAAAAATAAASGPAAIPSSFRALFHALPQRPLSLPPRRPCPVWPRHTHVLALAFAATATAAAAAARSSSRVVSYRGLVTGTGGGPQFPFSRETPPSWSSFFRMFFWRLRLGLKRSPAPLSVDDILALVSWLFVSKALFVLVGTTTAVSIALFIANTLNYEDIISHAVGRYITQCTGATVVVESAIVPNWKDGKITLKNVTVRRLRALDESQLPPPPPPPTPHSQAQPQFFQPQESEIYHADEDAKCNFTRYDLRIDCIDITLDLMRWLDNRGLVRDAVVSGVRGTIDRSGLRADNPTQPRRTSVPGEFDLDHVALHDLYVTVYNPGFRAYPFSVFSAHVPRLRKQWLLYDVLSATSLVGMLDNCLFSLHAPQGDAVGSNNGIISDAGGSPSALRKRVTQIKMDGLPIDHFNYGTVGPISWITSGLVDISAQIVLPLPRSPLDELSAQAIMRELVSELKSEESSKVAVATAATTATEADTSTAEKIGPRMELDMDVTFRDIRVTPPALNSPSVAYLAHAWIRPLASYMNSRHMLAIPLSARVELPLAQFDGSWTIYQAGLSDAVAGAVGRSIVANMMNEAERARRIRMVGLWSLQAVSRSFAAWWQLIIGRRPIVEHLLMR